MQSRLTQLIRLSHATLVRFALLSAALAHVTLSAVAAEPVGPRIRATLHDRSSEKTRFMSSPAEADKRLPALVSGTLWSAIKRIDLPSGSYEGSSRSHSRIVTLWTGESFVCDDYVVNVPEVGGERAAAVQPDLDESPDRGRRLTFPRLPDNDSAPVPVECVASIRTPRLARELVTSAYTVRTSQPDGSQELRRLMPHLAWSHLPVGKPFQPGSSATATLPAPVSSVQASLAIRCKTIPQQAVDRPLRVRFLFDGPDSRPREIVVHIGPLRKDRVNCELTSDISLSITPMQVHGSEVRIRMFLDRALAVSVNSRLIASAPRWSGKLRAIRVESPEDGSAAAFTIGAGLFRVRRARPAQTRDLRLLPVHDSDSILLNSGDELYGQRLFDGSHQSTAWNPDGDDIVKLESPNGAVFVPWTDIAAIRFRHSDSPIINRAADSLATRPGWLANLTLAPTDGCLRFGESYGGRLRAVILAAHPDGLRIDHPVLRSVTLPWSMLRRIEPLGFRTIQMLDAGPRHLGNAVREEFSSAEAVGTKWAVDWPASEGPEHPVWLTLEVAELIPSGPETLAASPHLTSVRDLFLATFVAVNGTVIGNLNSHVSVHYPAHSPRRIGLLIPAKLLQRKGVNTVRFSQTSARDDPTSFDDCEIRSIALEVERAY